MLPYTVKECLQGYTSELLGAMCDQRKLAPGDKKSARIRALERVLEDPLHTRQEIRELSPGGLRLARLLAERGGATVADILSVQALYAGRGGLDELTALVLRGLLLAVPRDQSGAFSVSQLRADYALLDTSPRMVIPGAVAECLPAEVPPLGLGLPEDPGPVDADPPVAPEHATSMLLETLRLAEVQHIRVTAAGALHKGDLAKVQEAARDSGMPPEMVRLALSMAVQMGCLADRDGGLATTATAESWAAQSRADRIRTLFQAYLLTEDLDETRPFFSQAADALDEHLPRRSLRRTYHKALVGEVVRENADGAWHAVADLVECLRLRDRNILLLEEPWRAIQANVQNGAAAWRDQAWQSCELRYFVWMLRTVYSGLGIVETARDGALFRVTPAGAHALGAGPAPRDHGEVRGDALVIQPDFEVIAYLDRCPPDLRRKLDTFCERLRGGVVATYRITRESMYRGVRSGTSLEEFLALLGGNSERGVPGNVRDQMATWGRKLESITIRTGCEVVECLTSQEAANLVREHAGARCIGERFALFENEPVSRCEARVAYDTPSAGFVEQEEGLCLRIPWETSDLFTLRKMARLGDLRRESTGDALVRIRPDQAGTSHFRFPQHELDILVREPLAPRFRAALRTLSGEGGAGASRTVTLVRFNDAETCDGVCDLPEAQGLVEGRLGRVTLIVEKGKLNAFKRALHDLGIPVKPAEELWDDGVREPVAAGPAPHADGGNGTDGGNGHRHENTGKNGGRTRGGRREKSRHVEELLPSYSPRIMREIIEDAISRRKPVLISYQSTWGPGPEVRRVNPANMDLLGPNPTLNGYCHKNKSSRTFKLSQVKGIRVIEDDSF
jgi:hypothetical protein